MKPLEKEPEWLREATERGHLRREFETWANLHTHWYKLARYVAVGALATWFAPPPGSAPYGTRAVWISAIIVAGGFLGATLYAGEILAQEGRAVGAHNYATRALRAEDGAPYLPLGFAMRAIVYGFVGAGLALGVSWVLDQLA